MIRLKVIVEGHTEETFVRDILADHLAASNVYPVARRVETGRRRIRSSRGGAKRVFRGGMTSYEKAKRDILRWIREESQSEQVYVTTMFDLYALPRDFPSFDDALARATPRERVTTLEEAFADDISFPRFVPYIQLHEFEALILSDPTAIAPQFERTAEDEAIRNLLEMCSQFRSPEEIDDGDQTAPSKRITREIPEYEDAKRSAGPMIVQRIGVPHIRARCPHFDEWLRRLERLGSIVQG